MEGDVQRFLLNIRTYTIRHCRVKIHLLIFEHLEQKLTKNCLAGVKIVGDEKANSQMTRAPSWILAGWRTRPVASPMIPLQQSRSKPIGDKRSRHTLTHPCPLNLFSVSAPK